MRKLHSLIMPVLIVCPSLGCAVKMTSNDLSPEVDKFLAEATAEFNSKQETLYQDLRLKSQKEWAFDQATGVLRLDYENGDVLLVDGQILGSYYPKEGTWEWAWNNPNALDAIARDSKKVRAIGKKFELDYLQTGIIPVPNEDFVFYLCAIGLKATDSIGVYKGTAGPITVYIMLKNPRWEKKSDNTNP